MRVEAFVGLRIRDRREELAMSQAELGQQLGDLLARPWTRQAVSSAEQGRRAFTAVELWAIAHVLSTRPARLLTPPVTLRAIDMPSGVRLSTRATTPELGVADALLGDMYDEIAVALNNLNASRTFSAEALRTVERLQEHITTVIAAAEAATMHPDPDRGKGDS